ncbi:MAG: alpha/beta hydrolase [Bacteroidota bacterium]|jgi:pimeloyl-ACP methyl ester carboxylesterase
MKKILIAILLVLSVNNFLYSQSIKKVVLNDKDAFSGYYLAIEPCSDSIAGVLVLLAGFGEKAEWIFPETKLHNVAYVNRILTIGFAEGNKISADSAVQSKLSAVLEDVLRKYKVHQEDFVLGGYSAGGIVAMRYVELCNEYPDKYPIRPKGIFTVDSPVDIVKLWDGLEKSYKHNYSDAAYKEAEYVMNYLKNDYGIPSENDTIYSYLSPFSMDTKYGEHEKYLKDIAVRTYHDVDIAWRLINSNQSVKDDNYFSTSELIRRLLAMGNKKAEFMQSYQTGYRSNGRRHPHSWSIVNEIECVQWIKGLLKK